MDKKEKWVNSVLNSLEGLEKAQPNSDLFSKITNQIGNVRVVKVVSIEHLSWIAAACSVLILINIFAYRYTSVEKNNQTTSNTTLITSYNLYE